jgi:hypothetical protein
LTCCLAAYDVPLLGELLPVICKLSYQLSIIPNAEAELDDESIALTHVNKSPSAQLLFAVINVIGVTKATQQAMLIAHPVIRRTLTHVLKSYCARKRSARQFVT